MKRIISLFLLLAFVFTGCSNSYVATESVNDSGVSSSAEDTEDTSVTEESAIDLSNYSDPETLNYIEESLYIDLVDDMSSLGDYYVEEVRATYVSQEYLDELEYNSQPNVYFGYRLEDIDQVFGGERYVFTLGDNGQTTIKTYNAYDREFEKILYNVATGTGVILVCVVVSVVSGPICPTMSLIFAEAAKSSSVFALTEGTLSASIAGTFKAIETGDMDQAVKAALVSGSEGYSSGAILGSVTGGTSQALKIVNIARHYPDSFLTATQIAQLQRKSKLPLDIIANIQTQAEYDAFMNAGLEYYKVGSRLSLIRRDIDLKYIDPAAGGKTNLQLMLEGKAPFDPATGLKYELHHIGQHMDSPLAILTDQEHSSFSHLIKESEINRNVFDGQRQQFWKDMAGILGV